MGNAQLQEYLAKFLDPLPAKTRCPGYLGEDRSVAMVFPPTLIIALEYHVIVKQEILRLDISMRLLL
ncbi:MAG TPA: hypothetical protein VFV38_39180 [Ktedonobacteraceae bacterium]|nr:hypothetical protein [Ktedonobacteraceae bacterium]